MKKLISILTLLTLTLGMSISAQATQAITFDESGNGTVTNKTEEKKEETKEEKSDEGGINSIIDSIFGGSSDNKEESKTDKKGYLALGADLTAEQKTTVLASMGISEADLGSYSIVTTTNAEEHAALDKYIDPALIGTRSLSSVLVKPAEEGHGVVVTTNNINYCTTNTFVLAAISIGMIPLPVHRSRTFSDCFA